MQFKIEQIDRAIEWALRDEVIKQGLWPAERTFIASNDKPGFDAAIAAMNPRIDVFGHGNYTSREQLKKNNLIIDREGFLQGDIGYAFPFTFDLMPNKTFDKIKTAEGTQHIEYELRFVCDDVTLDRKIHNVIQNAIGLRKFLPGMNDDLTNTEDTFLIERNGNTVNLSGKDFIEMIFRYIVRDVIIEEDVKVKEAIPPITQVTSISNVPEDDDKDVRYPIDQDNKTTASFGVADFFIGLIEGLSAWDKMEVCRLYANSTQAGALKNLRGPVSATNTGLTFTAHKGFNRTGANQYLDTKFVPSGKELFNLTSHHYAIFVTDAPTTGILELFGLVDTDNDFSFFLRSDQSTGIQAKGNSDNQLQLTFKVKANTLYVLNRRNSMQMEIFEGDKIIGTLVQQPTGIPNGRFAELNLFDESNSAIGVGISGGIGFSSIGGGLTGSEITDLNAMVRFYMTKVGVIPLS